MDEPEEPISREQFLRELVRPTGDEIAEADIVAAWAATPSLAIAPVTPAPVAPATDAAGRARRLAPPDGAGDSHQPVEVERAA